MYMRYVHACRAAIIVVLFDESDGLEVSSDDFGGKMKVGATAWRSFNIGHKFAASMEKSISK